MKNHYTYLPSGCSASLRYALSFLITILLLTAPLVAQNHLQIVNPDDWWWPFGEAGKIEEATISLEPKNEVAIELVNKIESNQMDTTLFTSNFGLERKINSFFRLNSLELRSTLNMQNNSDRDVFLKLRELRNNW